MAAMIFEIIESRTGACAGRPDLFGGKNSRNDERN
jgi:hypothetical protein